MVLSWRVPQGAYKALLAGLLVAYSGHTLAIYLALALVRLLVVAVVVPWNVVAEEV